MNEIQFQELIMFPFDPLIALFRRNRIRDAAIHDLRRLTPQQLADIGIPSDRVGEVVDAMLMRPEPFDLGARFKPELELQGLLPRPGYAASRPSTC